MKTEELTLTPSIRYIQSTVPTMLTIYDEFDD